jgi:hypothetical protein
MQKNNFGRVFIPALLCVVVLSLAATAFGQGKGQGGGRGQGGGAGNAGGPPAGVGVDRGLGNASGRSNGRSDDGLSTASDRSNGRSDAGLDRARMAENNRRNADKELREHPAIADAVHLNANDLRDGYQTALATNPDLKFGQYVAATRLAQNLGGRFPNITRDAILAGLADGDSLGRTLKNLGLSSQEADDAKKQAEREIKQAKH